MPNIRRREGASGELMLVEKASSTTIKNITKSTMDLVVLFATWLANKLAEVRAMYFFEDVRMPSTEGVRRDREKGPRTRPNAPAQVGLKRIHKVVPHNLESNTDRWWEIHLEDGTQFNLYWADLFRDDVTDDERKFLGEIIKMLGYTNVKVGGKLVPSFGGYLGGFDMKFSSDVVTFDRHGRKVTRTVQEWYNIGVRWERINKGREPSVVNDPNSDQFLSRLNRIEERRTNRDDQNQDNSSDMYTHGLPVMKYEFADPFSLPGDESIWVTGEARGKGLVHPAFMVGFGKYQNVAKMEDNGDGTVTFKNVARTIKIHLPDGREFLSDHFVEQTDYWAYQNAIRRELRWGNNPFYVECYDGTGKYERHKLGVDLPIREGETIEIPKSCSGCRNRHYRTEIHGLVCTNCGSHLWRTKIVVFLPIYWKGKMVTDVIARYMKWDPNQKGTHLRVELFGWEVGNLVRNMLREGYNPSMPRYEIKLVDVVDGQPVYRKVFTGVQRFWFWSPAPEAKKKRKKSAFNKPYIYDGMSALNSEVEVPKVIPNNKEWMASLEGTPSGATAADVKKYYAARFNRAAGYDKAHKGWVSPAFIAGHFPQLELVHKSRSTTLLINKALRVIYKKRAQKRLEVDAMMRMYKIQAKKMAEIDAMELLGLVKVARNPDGSINLD